ncbi:Pentatricopeptide repeat (PPR) superfamily protein [Rhynchospora pubera]|uniref:Pentatricopeptide repeat (PPR) superfamily protein n=1 Tax=Rhynchospora pubera TaxID=906938 RepID=A0AAV8GWQ7_9POAL|nr:Pentatricopeptide repeat (PPR) superfamily protein [Rhynchospora pubera]
MPRKLLPKQISTFIQTQTNIRLSIEAFISSPTPHSISTYRSLLQNLASHGELNQLDTVLSHMRQRHTDPSSHEPAYVAAMRGYSRGARLQDAVDVFERMPLYDCEPSVVSYNVIMNALVDHGYFDQAHKVYMRMLDKGITADTCTHTVRVKAFCLTRRPHTAMRLLRNMAERVCAVSAVTYCTVVCGFYEMGFISDARQVFDEMLNWGLFPDLVDFNKVLHVLCKKGDMLESLRLLAVVTKIGLQMNLFSYNLLILGLCKGSRLNEAVNLLENMHKSMTPDVTTYNTVINGLCQELRVSEAAKYLPKMFNSGCFPDSFTYNIIIDGYCKKGMVQDACELLKDAVFRGFVPDNVTYGSLINGLCEEGDFKRAVEFFNKSQANGFTPDIFMYNSLIKGLCRQGLVLQALEVLHAMPDSGCTPDIRSYNIVINGVTQKMHISCS